MAGGQSSNLVGASSFSTPTRKPKGTKRIRQQNATHGEEANKQPQQRHPHLRLPAAHPTGAAAAAIPVVPLHYTPASNAMPKATLPMAAAGVNGAALRWTTAVALAAEGTKAPVWSLPVVAGTTATGQAVVSVPLPLISYEAAAMAGSRAAAAAPPPLVEVLENIRSDTLGRLLTAVMRACDPPMLQPQSWAAASGAPPPWWLAAADTVPENTPVPFAPPYKLRKEEKVAVLVAIVKHHAPDLEAFASDALCEKAKLSNDPEAAKWWKRALAIEAARHNNIPVPNAPVVNLIMAPHAGAGHLPAASGSVTGTDVAAPAADDGGRGLQVVAGGKPEQKQEQPGDGVLSGGTMEAEAGVEKPVNFLGDEFAAADLDQLLDDMLAPLAQQAIDAEAEAPDGATAAVEAAALEERHWYMNDDNTSFFDDFEPLTDENGKSYLDYLGDLW